MDDLPRPSADDVETAFNNIFNSSLSLSKLKDAAVDGHLASVLCSRRPTSPSTIPITDVVGRSIAWKVFLIPQPPLTSALPASPASPLSTLISARSKYVELLKEKLRAPDGSYEAGFSVPGEDPPLTMAQGIQGDWQRNNPLSLDEKNPWQDWFASVELRRTIAQDVERTFPDIPYFRKPDVQSSLTTILFLQSVEDPEIGYRQGMHEILAPLFYAIDRDSLDPATSSVPAEVRELCDRTWVAADSWLLFSIMMKNVRTWYEWREPPPRLLTDGPIQTQSWVAPIVRICGTIQSKYLRTVDPALYSTLRESGIEPQLYGMRWLRLLFSREFGMIDILPLWDGIFAIDPSFEIAHWICVAMLVRIRNRLIPSDYSGQLTALLRYPPLPPQEHKLMPHTNLLLRQALNVRSTPTPTSGVTLMMENRDILGIPSEVPEPEVQREQNRLPIRNRPGSAGGDLDRRDSVGLQDLIASRWSDVNSAVFSTVSELRRNLPELSLPELSAALLRPQEPSPETNPMSSTFPYEGSSRRIGHRPWEPSSRFELETEIMALRTAQLKLAEAMEWSLEVLQRTSEEQERKSALSCLAYVQQTLRYGTTVLDRGRLAPPNSLIDAEASRNDSTAAGTVPDRSTKADLSEASSDISGTAPTPPLPSPSEKPQHPLSSMSSVPSTRPFRTGSINVGSSTASFGRASPFSRHESRNDTGPMFPASRPTFSQQSPHSSTLGRSTAATMHIRSPSQPLTSQSRFPASITTTEGRHTQSRTIHGLATPSLKSSEDAPFDPLGVLR
ncbi:hypothetical protein FRB99_006207 [Tulasnella sp. 403]|nr:hypothetical protein FRB99_006207 [Tulasnella sp. 403]